MRAGRTRRRGDVRGHSLAQIAFGRGRGAIAPARHLGYSQPSIASIYQVNTMIECSAQARAELTPKGKLRVGINFSNFLLTHKHPQTGAPGGVAVDLGRELARRIGAEAEIIGYPSPGELAEAAPTDIWDVGFLGDEPARAKLIDFSPDRKSTRLNSSH